MNAKKKEEQKNKENPCESFEDLEEQLQKTDSKINKLNVALNKVNDDLNNKSSNDNLLKSHNLKMVFEYADGLSKYSFLKRAIFSALAGFFVGIAYLVYVIIRASFYNGGTAPSQEFIAIGSFLGSLMFPFAIFAIIYLGGNLFTSNCLMYLATLKKIIKFKYFLYQLLLTWIFNFIGALIMVGISYLILWDNVGAHDVSFNIAEHKLNNEWYSILASGFICNVIITGCIYGYKVIPSKTVGFLFVYLLIVFFAMSGMHHTVANMYVIPLGLSYIPNELIIANPGIVGEYWGKFFYYNLLPVTFSNTLGGLTIPLLYILAESNIFQKQKKQKKTSIDVKNIGKDSEKDNLGESK